MDELPRLLAGPPLQIPDSLREIGVEAVVVLEFVIDTTGRAEPASITVVESPHPALTDIAREAVLVSMYSPGRTNCVTAASAQQQLSAEHAEEPRDDREGTNISKSDVVGTVLDVLA